MESESTPSSNGPEASEQLLAVERARALVYTRYPVLGPWYPPLFGTWAAAFVAAYALPRWYGLAALGVLLLAGGAVLRWYVGKRGVMPGLRGAPRFIRRRMMAFGLGYSVVVAAIVATYVLIGWRAASILGFVTMTVLVAAYEAAYADAARRDEAALGIEPAAGAPA